MLATRYAIIIVVQILIENSRHFAVYYKFNTLLLKVDFESSTSSFSAVSLYVTSESVVEHDKSSSNALLNGIVKSLKIQTFWCRCGLTT